MPKSEAPGAPALIGESGQSELGTWGTRLNWESGQSELGTWGTRLNWGSGQSELGTWGTHLIGEADIRTPLGTHFF